MNNLRGVIGDVHATDMGLHTEQYQLCLAAASLAILVSPNKILPQATLFPHHQLLHNFTNSATSCCSSQAVKKHAYVKIYH